MKIGIKKEVEVEAKTLNICAKCCDMCSASLHDQNGDQIGDEWDNYVPKGLGIGSGDYIEFEVNLDTGQILNWEVPEKEAIEDFLEIAKENNQ
jgi:hypothetical protein